MTPVRDHTPWILRSQLAVLAASFLLAGCGSTAPTGVLVSGSHSDPDATTPSSAEAALALVKAPPGFQVGKCEFRPTGSNTRCYRRKTFIPLDTAGFTALITASGLMVHHGSLPMWCWKVHPHHPIALENCSARATLGSVEFAVSATSVKILHRKALRPGDLKMARSLRGTSFEVTLATNAGP
jgi:hypothetical protein